MENNLLFQESYDSLEESFDDYYNDFVLTEINEAVFSLLCYQSNCDLINKFITKKTQKELICEIINNYYKTNSIKLNFHCENFVAKMTWNEKTKCWKYTKIILD
jgi:hypothetical protein